LARHRIEHRTRDLVGGAARRERHDGADGLRWPVLRGRRAEQKRRDAEHGKTGSAKRSKTGAHEPLPTFPSMHQRNY
jgi:hypothetical protein